MIFCDRNHWRTASVFERSDDRFIGANPAKTDFCWRECSVKYKLLHQVRSAVAYAVLYWVQELNIGPHLLKYSASFNWQRIQTNADPRYMKKLSLTVKCSFRRWHSEYVFISFVAINQSVNQCSINQLRSKRNWVHRESVRNNKNTNNRLWEKYEHKKRVTDLYRPTLHNWAHFTVRRFIFVYVLFCVHCMHV